MSGSCSKKNLRKFVSDPSFLDSVERGSLLQFKREGGFDHWAVYMGGRQICHLTVDSDLFGLIANGLRSGKGEISVQPYEEVASDSVVYINNNRDAEWKPYPPQEIVKRAGSRCGENIYYNLATYNCEHFANWCRYGRAVSEQVQDATAATLSGSYAGSYVGLAGSMVSGPVGGSFAGSVGGSCSSFGSSRAIKSSREGEKKD